MSGTEATSLAKARLAYKQAVAAQAAAGAEVAPKKSRHQRKASATPSVDKRSADADEAPARPAAPNLTTAWETLDSAKRSERERWATRAFALSTIVIWTLVLGLVIGGAVGAHETGGDRARECVALIIAAVVVLGGFWLVGLLWFGPAEGGVVGFIVGADNRLSTSLLQVLLWTAVVTFAFAMFTAELGLGVRLGDQDGFASFDGTYLLLLGGPFAAAVLAKLAAVTKSDDARSQQALADTPSAKDLGTDDAGKTSLTDFQFLVFNLAAIAFFAVAFAQHPTSLPTIPSTLAGLTSVSALTYVGGKVVNANPPTVSSVSIAAGGDGGKLVPGQTVIRVLGKNFMPAGSDTTSDLDATVLVGGTEMAPPLIVKSDTELQGTVPAGLAPGPTTILARTPDGSTSQPWPGFDIA